MPYIHFTDEQKQRAAAVDLEQFLPCQGETLISSGREKRLERDHSVTVQGNQWYDHASKEGGGPISFVQKFYHLSYQEAITLLLGNQRIAYAVVAEKKEKPKKEFALPPANRDMRRVYAYLLQRRLLSRDVVSAFAHDGLLYESRELSADGAKEYHNAVFVGRDEHGVPRHAHKRDLHSVGPSFKRNVPGCDPKYSFHHTGSDDRLYVFEAPIDLLSFATLYQKNWRQHSYVSLCGTGEHAMLWVLEQNPNLRKVILCLDHDEAGIEANGRLAEILRKHGYTHVTVLQPSCKDWNEDLKAANGLPAQPAEKHPQLIVAPDICRLICEHSRTAHPDQAKESLPELLRQYKTYLHCGHPGKAMETMEQASAIALAAYDRELRQLGKAVSSQELQERLCRRIRPHRNQCALEKRHRELGVQIRNMLAQNDAPGIRGAAEKQSMAETWLELAADFAAVSVKYEADELKRWQKQRASQAMTM